MENQEVAGANFFRFLFSALKDFFFWCFSSLELSEWKLLHILVRVNVAWEHRRACPQEEHVVPFNFGMRFHVGANTSYVPYI